ncbi:transmembrane transport protein [Streptomyces sp. CC228A]|uniref:transmembrane transport protein n=1 Tax=Streptomyces sp. CC228A TaxID=2898186 RepID=UPI001F21317F|nr:transmembrane transport protein [Streptomyces sp. CC228A]
MNDRDDTAGGRVPAQLDRLLAAEVSLRSRMRHVAVGLAGGAGAALLTVLWATEPRPLPVRTQAAFAGLIAVGLAWAAFAGWVLTRRRPLFARDRVIGARLALAVAVVTCGAGTALAAARSGAAQTLAAGMAGACLVTAAAVLLRRAGSRRRELLRLRDALRQDTD